MFLLAIDADASKKSDPSKVGRLVLFDKVNYNGAHSYMTARHSPTIMTATKKIRFRNCRRCFVNRDHTEKGCPSPKYSTDLYPDDSLPTFTFEEFKAASLTD